MVPHEETLKCNCESVSVTLEYLHLRKTSPLPLWRDVSYLTREVISRFTRWSNNKVVPLLLSVAGVPAL